MCARVGVCCGCRAEPVSEAELSFLLPISREGPNRLRCFSLQSQQADTRGRLLFGAFSTLPVFARFLLLRKKIHLISFISVACEEELLSLR